MKKPLLVFGISSALSCLVIFGSLFYQGSLAERLEALSAQKKQKLAVTEDLHKKLTFLREKSEDLQKLKEKGWEMPQSRLKASQSLERSAEDALLNALFYEFSPEKGESDLKRTRVTVEVTGVLDQDIFSYLDKIRDDFPGIIQLRSLALTRHEPLTREALEHLHQGGQPDFVLGKIAFDWVSLGGGATIEASSEEETQDENHDQS